MIVNIRRDRTRNGRYHIECSNLASTSISLAQSVEGGWKRWACGRVYPSMITLIKAVMSDWGVSESTEYEIRGLVEALEECGAI